MTSRGTGRGDPSEDSTEEADSLADLARSRRHLLMSVRVNAVLLLVVGLVLWGLSKVMHLPRSLVIVIVGVLVFSVVGDVVHILHFNAQIRRRVGRSIRQRRQQS